MVTGAILLSDFIFTLIIASLSKILIEEVGEIRIKHTTSKDWNSHKF